MVGRGFIHDKLEIKFLILYIAARVIEPVPFDTLLDLTLCDDAIDYFDFSECLADLVKTEHITLDEASGLYAITEKGRRNSEICETSLPYSVRLRCDKNLSICNRALRRKNQVRSATEPRPNGTYTVLSGTGRRHGQRDGSQADGAPGGYGEGCWPPASARRRSGCTARSSTCCSTRRTWTTRNRNPRNVHNNKDGGTEVPPSFHFTTTFSSPSVSCASAISASCSNACVA